MAKQKAKPKGSRKRAEGQAPPQDTKPNLFERLYNRKKFDILGKKTKGERKYGQSVHDAVDKVRHQLYQMLDKFAAVSQQRSPCKLLDCVVVRLAKRLVATDLKPSYIRPACVLQRKKTLLVEYRQLRKANAFVDRRFGEEDESLTAEEKAIARFQKQRMKEFGGKSNPTAPPHNKAQQTCSTVYLLHAQEHKRTLIPFQSAPEPAPTYAYITKCVCPQVQRPAYLYL